MLEEGGHCLVPCHGKGRVVPLHIIKFLSFPLSSFFNLLMMKTQSVRNTKTCLEGEYRVRDQNNFSHFQIEMCSVFNLPLSLWYFLSKIYACGKECGISWHSFRI